MPNAIQYKNRTERKLCIWFDLLVGGGAGHKFSHKNPFACGMIMSME